jgi:hypothetical protein
VHSSKFIIQEEVVESLTHFFSPNIHKGRWTENEDAILRYSVLEYASVTDPEGRLQPIPWNKIAERIPNRTGIQCQARWTEALDPYVRKGKWGLEEDALLRMGVNDFGRCWIRIAETIPGRTQVRHNSKRFVKSTAHLYPPNTETMPYPLDANQV